ncbi:MAG: shikimate dehydrogenase [Bifidobacteriaceae bacterium]|nr:shikimate dehydrogenase [Bifidobacteriaceae bacterium]
MSMNRCAVLGKPIAHSLSPVLHNAAYQALGLQDWCYDKVEVGEDDLENFLNQITPCWRGLSLTMPLKKTILPFGTLQNIWAQELQVANTAKIRWDNSERTSYFDLYNTDVDGIIHAFEHAWSTKGFTSNASHAMILGNGNTAFSALAALTKLVVKDGLVTIVSRHSHNNQQLQSFATAHDLRCEFVDYESAVSLVQHMDIVISTVPAHAADNFAQELINQHVQPHASLLDVVYSPRETVLKQAWENSGTVSMSGEEMLIYQAIEQVIIMTECGVEHKEIIEQAMRKALKEVL